MAGFSDVVLHTHRQDHSDMTNEKDDQNDGGLSTESDSTVEITPPDDSQAPESTDTQDNG